MSEVTRNYYFFGSGKLKTLAEQYIAKCVETVEEIKAFVERVGGTGYRGPSGAEIRCSAVLFKEIPKGWQVYKYAKADNYPCIPVRNTKAGKALNESEENKL